MRRVTLFQAHFPRTHFLNPPIFSKPRKRIINNPWHIFPYESFIRQNRSESSYLFIFMCFMLILRLKLLMKNCQKLLHLLWGESVCENNYLWRNYGCIVLNRLIKSWGQDMFLYKSYNEFLHSYNDKLRISLNYLSTDDYHGILICTQ